MRPVGHLTHGAVEKETRRETRNAGEYSHGERSLVDNGREITWALGNGVQVEHRQVKTEGQSQGQRASENR